MRAEALADCLFFFFTFSSRGGLCLNDGGRSDIVNAEE